MIIPTKFSALLVIAVKPCAALFNGATIRNHFKNATVL
jgi:hypothetical protein